MGNYYEHDDPPRCAPGNHKWSITCCHVCGTRREHAVQGAIRELEAAGYTVTKQPKASEVPPPSPE